MDELLFIYLSGARDVNPNFLITLTQARQVNSHNHLNPWLQSFTRAIHRL